MKIALINPSYMDKPPEMVRYARTGFTVPHLGIGYLAAALGGDGHTVDIYECMAFHISTKKMLDIILEKKYDMIGISTYTGNLHNTIKLLTLLKKHKCQSFIFLGGYFATISPESILKKLSNVKCCVLGEGEQTVKELALAVENSHDLSQISGLAMIKNGDVHFTEKRELIKNLDILPFPKRVFYASSGEVSMVTSRGCNNMCSFCSIKVFYGKCKGGIYRYRSADNVIMEIKHHIKAFKGMRSIVYYDDNFLEDTPGNIKRLNLLCDKLIEENIKIPFSITTTAKNIIKHKKLLERLKDVGLYNIFVGIESFNERQLNLYRKHTTIEENIECLKILSQLQIIPTLGFIHIDPFSTLEEIKDQFLLLSRDYMEKYLDRFIFPFSTYPPLISVKGTVIEKIIEKEGLQANNTTGYDFKDKRVDTFCKILKKWNLQNKVMNNNYLLLIHADEAGEEDLINSVGNGLKKYNAIDRDFVIHLCDFIADKGTEVMDQDMEVLIEEWRGKVMEIEKEFLVYREKLQVQIYFDVITAI